MTTQPTRWRYLTILLVLVVTTSAQALMIAPAPVPLRVAGADLVVHGKVKGFEDKLIKSELFKNDLREMQVAIVEVKEVLLGDKVKQIKVGFFPPPAAPGAGPGGRPVRRYPTVQLIVGEESLAYLTRHPTKKDLYVAQMYFDVTNQKNNPNFSKELDEARKAAKMLANAKTGLTSRDPEERFTTAALLVTRYRTPRQGSTRTEPIPAQESKLILQALAKADWNTRGPRNFQMNPQTIFFRLGLTAKDGWDNPEDFRQLPERAKKWLEANADKYRIQRILPPEAPPSTEP